MNIFVVDESPYQAAVDLCDRHVLKMGIESTQILSTVLRSLGVEAPMKSTHIGHPCTKWAAKTSENFKWLLHHGKAIFQEYTARYDKIHASEWKLDWIQQQRVRPPEGPLTKFATAIKPVEIISDDPITSYRVFYIVAKSKFAKWAHGPEPTWWRHFWSTGTLPDIEGRSRKIDLSSVQSPLSTL